MGKTALALNIAEHVAVKEGLPVVVFSMEAAACLAARACVWSVRSAASTRATCAPATCATMNGGASRRRSEARQGQPLHRRAARSGRARSGPAPAARRASAASSRLIVVDYLQLMSGSDGTSDENRATVIGEISAVRSPSPRG
jgi:replicative DNA helicase